MEVLTVTKSEVIKEFFKKSVLPVAVAALLYCIFKSACTKDGVTDYVWLFILCGLAAAGGCLVYSLDHLPTIFGKKHLLYSRVDLNERHLLMTLISISFSFCNMW